MEKDKHILYSFHSHSLLFTNCDPLEKVTLISLKLSFLVPNIRNHDACLSLSVTSKFGCFGLQVKENLAQKGHLSVGTFIIFLTKMPKDKWLGSSVMSGPEITCLRFPWFLLWPYYGCHHIAS